MLVMIDFKTDDSDDIILNDDIQTDDSLYDSTIKTVERRLVARGEDFILDDIAAGLESFIHSHKTTFTNTNILSAIVNAAETNRLLLPSDYTLLVEDTADKRFHILIKFSNSLLSDSNAFRIIVDTENQRVYRG